MNSKDRILTTINHDEPDQVPIYELSIESLDVVKGYGGKEIIGMYDLNVEEAVDLYQKIGIDLHMVPVSGLPIGKSAGFGKKKPGLNTPAWSNWADEFGRIYTFYKSKDSELELTNYVGGMFFSVTNDLEEIMAKYEKWAPLDANIKLRFKPYERAMKAANDKGPYNIPGFQGFFENSWQPFGFENYTRLLYEQPDFIDEVLKNIEVFLIELVEILIERYSIELLMYLDDHGHKTGPLLSPRLFQKLIYPRIKKLVKLCHKNDVKVIFHSCGNVNKLLDKIIDSELDGLNPLEPAASMDIFQVHQDYGDKLALIGNVDPIHLLAKGTPKQVEDYVKKEIKYCAPGGGLIISSGHSINQSTPFENFNAMIQATKKYGTYPIKFE